MIVRTRTVTQIRTHAQKYLKKLSKAKGKRNKVCNFCVAEVDPDFCCFELSVHCAHILQGGMSIAPEHLEQEKEDIKSYISSSATNIPCDTNDMGWNAHSREVAARAENSTKRCSFDFESQSASGQIMEASFTPGCPPPLSVGYSNAWVRPIPPFVAKRPQLMMVLSCRIPGVIDNPFHDQRTSTHDGSHLPHSRF